MPLRSDMAPATQGAGSSSAVQLLQQLIILRSSWQPHNTPLLRITLKSGFLMDNAEQCPFLDERANFLISKYGAAIRCDPLL
jgi:hypothetical protein